MTYSYTQTVVFLNENIHGFFQDQVGRQRREVVSILQHCIMDYFQHVNLIFNPFFLYFQFKHATLNYALIYSALYKITAKVI